MTKLLQTGSLQCIFIEYKKIQRKVVRLLSQPDYENIKRRECSETKNRNLTFYE